MVSPSLRHSCHAGRSKLDPNRHYAFGVLAGRGTLVRQLLFSGYQYQLYRALEASTDSQLAAIAAKAIKEVSYHLEHAATWVCRLGDGTEFSHDLTQAAVDEVWPYTHDLFSDDPVFERVAAAGVGPLPSSLREPWQATEHTVRIDELLEDLAGNTPVRVFDTDLDKPTGPKAKLTLPFRPQ